ncbi:MAG TPA: PDZ domain-containing protein [Dehalococcoidia bacterium]
MDRRLLIPIVILGAALLIVSGALAGVLIAGDGNGGDKGTDKGYLGLRVSVPLVLGRDIATGLRVASVEADGPAARAGIRVGDVIRAVDGEVVRTPEALRRTVEAKKPGTRIVLTYERGDRELRAEVTLGEAPPGAQIEAMPIAPGRAPTPALQGLPPRLRELLQRQLEGGQVRPEELLPLLERVSSDSVRVGRVVEASETSVTVQPIDGGLPVTMALTEKTTLQRAVGAIKAADLQKDEVVLLLSMDGGATAFAVLAFGP